MGPQLTISDHARDSAGMRYVYPVVSRRAAGVSIGINLNTNNACNWRCIYCQVPDLARGAAPPVDLLLLERELREMLSRVLSGDFLESRVPEGMRRLNDIALSGNGEPTSAREIADVVQVIAQVRAALGVGYEVKTVLITNGSLLRRASVREALRRLATIRGEVWFKVDRVTGAGLRQVNGTRRSPESIFEDLRMAASLCPTWVQTCLFAMDGLDPSPDELETYAAFLERLARVRAGVRGVYLYGLARPSLQPEAPRLSPCTPGVFDALARRLKAAGYEVRVTP